MSDTDNLITLSTQIEPAIPFTVDGERYELRTLSHMTKFEEAKVRALSKREEWILREIESTSPTNEERVMKLADSLAEIRVEILALMTTLPRDKIEALPIVAQRKLVLYAGMEIGALRKLLAVEHEVEEQLADDAEGAVKESVRERARRLRRA
jgi:hypothetical protein